MATKNTVRKAVMVKHTPYKFGKRFSKGDNVEIQEIPLGRGEYSYTATNPKDSSILAQAVTPSMFEYTDAETFIVFTKRTITSYRNVEVKAKTKKEAERLALELAKDLEFEDPETNHTFHGAMTETDYKKLFK